MAARIAFLDLETAPNLGYVWGIWDQDVIDIKENWYILSYAIKWNNGATHTRALPDYPLYKKDRENDRSIVKDLHGIFEEADIVVAHNGDRFDIRKANARFIYHGLRPPTSYNTIDTLKIARKHFKFDSNRLDALGKYLGVGRKLPHTGKHLWLGCMAGDPAAWRMIRRYNAQDVELLWRVYQKLKPWASSHPNLNLWSGKKNCPVCQSGHVQKNGQRYLKTTVRQQYRCMSCDYQWHGETISPVDIRLGERTKKRMEAGLEKAPIRQTNPQSAPRRASGSPRPRRRTADTRSAKERTPRSHRVRSRLPKQRLRGRG